MKSRTLIILVVVLAALGGLAWWTSQDARPTSDYATGQALLPDLDPNAVGQITLTSGTNVIQLARTDAGWVVASHWNIPADFARLTDVLRTLANLKVGEIIRGGTDTLEDFGLAAASNNLPTLPAQLQLRTTNGTEAGRVVLGQPRAASQPESFLPPDSQYVRVNDGPVLLVSPYVEELPRRVEAWLDSTILEVAGSNVVSMQVTRLDGSRHGLRRTGETFEGLDALTGKVINVDGANLWLSTWQNLSTASILDPASDRAALGLDAPDTVEARTRDGLIINVKLGKPNEREERPALFQLSWEAPPLTEGLEDAARAAAEKEQQATGERVMAMQKRVSPWIYLLPASTAKQLTMMQEQLVVAGSPTSEAPSAPASEPAK